MSQLLPIASSSIGPSPDSGSKPVEYTISQDRSAGTRAQVEEGYALLAKGDAISSQVQLAQSASSNGALQDYQMQLMLLEQQNKKRIMMARTEPMPDLFSSFGTPETGPPRPDRTIPINSGTDSDIDNLTDDGQAQPEPVTVIQPENVEEQQTSATDSSLDAESQLNASYCILYRVSCSSQRHQCDRRIYQDEPRQVTIRIGVEGHYNSHLEDHLGGDKPVPDLRAFLTRRPNLAFVIYRDFRCEVGSTSSILGINSSKLKHPGRRNNTTFFREIISVVSEDLQNTLQQSSLFSPNKNVYRTPGYPHPPGMNSTPDSSDSLSSSSSEYTHRYFYHHREILRAKAADSTDDSVVSDGLRALVEYLDTDPDPMYAKCDNLFSRGFVTQETLPWIYRPNEVVVSTGTSGVLLAYVLKCLPATESGGSTLRFSCWNWGYDGHLLRRKDSPLTVQIHSYGETKINELTVYPLRFASQEVKDKLLANGNKFWAHRNQVQVAYQGPDYQHERSYPPDSRFMIDYQVYSKFHSNSPAFVFSTVERAPFDTWPETVSNDERLTEIQRMILPAGIHGFYFKEKKWMHLLVDHLRPVNWNKVAFEQLVLPKRTKSLVKALVMVRKEAWEEQSGENVENGLNGNLKKDDIIAGKGNGLIMLLHGGPGTGKTLTAESVAELAEMPLYSVTCGDIGTKPEAVEKYLNTVLYLGKKWNCVLLLDEADVFLEQRSLSDLDRNSLVSVFLRTLEYYDGVLILTSNRVSTFDDAFKSRIQLALHYPALNTAGRRKIWNNFLDMLNETTPSSSSPPPTNKVKTGNKINRQWEEKIDLEDIKSHMEELASYELNGRQIRNALTTARQLALFEKTVLDWEGLKDSIEVAGDFNRYVESMHSGYGGGSQHGAETGIGTGTGTEQGVPGSISRDRDEEGSWVSTGTFR